MSISGGLVRRLDGSRRMHQDQTRKRDGGAMRFIVMVKANKDSESGVLPTEEQLGEMGKFNDELAKPGGMLPGAKHPPSSPGPRTTLAAPNRPDGATPLSQTYRPISL